MRKLKSLWLVSVVLLLVSCSMSAKSDKSSEAGTASKGEVVTLNKAEFLQKVFNYEKNATKWVYEGDKPCIIDFYADWCGPCKQVAPILRDLAILYKNDCPISEIILRQEFSLFGSIYDCLGSFIPHSVNTVQCGHQFAVNDLKTICLGTVKIDWHELQTSCIHFLYNTHIFDRILFFL